MMKFTLVIAFLCGAILRAQDASAPRLAPPVMDSDAPDDGVRVSVLGYHDFSETEPETAMRIHTTKFRKQMETIRQLGITVISLEEFAAWKSGGKDIPEKSILLTFDDGWKSVYTDAFPILKEFGYPYTLYLYKNYVDGGGKALTTPMIREMIEAGATIGSHSVSHPYPVAFKSCRKKGAGRHTTPSCARKWANPSGFSNPNSESRPTPTRIPADTSPRKCCHSPRNSATTYGFTVQPGKVETLNTGRNTARAT